MPDTVHCTLIVKIQEIYTVHAKITGRDYCCSAVIRNDVTELHY